MGTVVSTRSGWRRRCITGGRRGEDGLRPRLERALQRAVGADVHHVPGALQPGMLVVAEVERGHANGGGRAAAGGAPVAFGAVFNHLSGGDQIQVARIAEEQVVSGELLAEHGVPEAARADIEDAVARVVNDLAGMVKLELVLDSLAQRLGRDHQKQIVAAAHQIDPQRIALEHFGGAAVDGGLGDRHFGSDFERQPRAGRRPPPSPSRASPRSATDPR